MARRKGPPPVVVGVDTGGTFTDLVLLEDGALRVEKVASTPDDPGRAVLEALARVGAAGEAARIVHGTTVATNTLLERDGARCALITNRGFEDLIEIGRQNRPSLYDIDVTRPPALVPRSLRFPIPQRTLADGSESRAPSDAEIARLIRRLEPAKVESIAIGLLFAYLDPKPERRIARALKTRLKVPLSLSGQLAPEFREYERFSTTVINAYVAPRMNRYLGGLVRSLGRDRLWVMQSNGGWIAANEARREPVRTVLSGPAGGVAGAFEAGREAGFDRLISFDMGGTSTDVSLQDGRITTAGSMSIGELPVRLPVISIHTVGAGGGSIARIDSGGGLKVGPESAGADPGPLCYGRGTEPTVTDANLVAGRLPDSGLLGGTMALDAARARDGIARLASHLGVSLDRAAEGILEIANATMVRAIKTISLQQGHDPHDFSLVAFGGAGGLHGCDLARELGLPRVLIPRHPGALSAWGMARSDIVRDAVRTVLRPIGGASDRRFLETGLDRLARVVTRQLAAHTDDASRIVIERAIDLRYRGQSYEIPVPWSESLIDDFHDAHERLYSHRHAHRSVEAVTLRVRGSIRSERSPVRTPSTSRRRRAKVEERPALFRGQRHATRFIAREDLSRSTPLRGPAVVTEFSSTTVVPPDFVLRVVPSGCLVIEPV